MGWHSSGSSIISKIIWTCLIFLLWLLPLFFCSVFSFELVDLMEFSHFFGADIASERAKYRVSAWQVIRWEYICDRYKWITNDNDRINQKNNNNNNICIQRATAIIIVGEIYTLFSLLFFFSSSYSISSSHITWDKMKCWNETQKCRTFYLKFELFKKKKLRIHSNCTF